jgi:uncharacterized membrane protein
LIRIDKEVTVSTSLERVFNYVSNPENWPEVWPSLMKLKNARELENGGYAADYEYKMAGMRFKGTGEFTEHIPNKWIVVRTRGGIKSTITITFRSVRKNGGEKTRVTLTIEYEVPIPLLGKLAEYIILKMNEQEADLVVVNLQARFLIDY